MARENLDLAVEQQLYGDEICPQLVMFRATHPGTRLAWVAREPEVGDQGLALAVEWLDPQTGSGRSAITQDLPADFASIETITRSLIEGGLVLTRYHLAGRTFGRSLQPVAETPLLRRAFTGEGVQPPFFWPFAKARHLLKIGATTEVLA